MSDDVRWVVGGGVIYCLTVWCLKGCIVMYFVSGDGELGIDYSRAAGARNFRGEIIEWGSGR